MINHDVVRLHIPVHDPLAMAEVQSLKQLEDVVPDVEILELGIQAAEICVVDIFENQRRSLALVERNQGVSQYILPGKEMSNRYQRIGQEIVFVETDLVVPHDIKQSYNVGSTRKVLQDLDLSFYLLLLHRLENLDDAFLIIDDIYALEYFGVLSASCNSYQQQTINTYT